jgi:predicted nucleic acid-binding protein
MLDNDYNQINKTVVSINKDYNLSFIDIVGGVAKREYIEINKEDLKNFLSEEQLDDIDTLLHDKKLKSLFPTKHDIRINKNGKIEISVKPKNDISIKEDLFI